MRMPGRNRVHGRAAVSAGIAPGRGADQELFGDRFEIGAEMHRALVDEDGLLGRLDADIAVHRLVRELRLVRTDDHPDIADPQGCRRSHIHVAAAIIGTGRDEFSVGQVFDDECLLIRRVARNARFAAERQRDGRADAGGMRGLGGGGIEDHADRGALCVVADQRAQHARGVGIAAGAGIVLGVGDDDRLVRARRQFHGVAHALVGREDAAVEIVFVALDQRGDVVRSGVGVGLRPAIGEHARSAMGKIRRRKARREGQRRHRVALQRRQLLIDASGGLVVGALPADRNQERQLPERFRKALLRAQAAARDVLPRRGRCRPCRHADRCGRRSVRRHVRPFRASHWRAGRG